MQKRKFALPQTLHPYEILFIAAFLLYLFASTYTGDDAWFDTVYDYHYSQNLRAFLTFRYYTWSTRLLLEGFTILLVRVPLLYRLSMPLWLVAIAYGADRLAGGLDRKAQWAMCLGLLLLPLAPFGQVGYVCSTVNYVFTMACMIWAIVPAVEKLRGKGVPLWQQIISPVLMLIGGNMEYYCPPALIVTIWLIVSSIRKKKNPVLPILLTLAVLAAAAFAANAPTNTASAYAASGVFPGYEQLSAVSKLQAGFVSTVGGSLSTYSGGSGSLLIGALTLAVLLVLRLGDCTAWYDKALHLVPLIITLGTGCAARLLPKGNTYRTLFFDPQGGWLWNHPLTTVLAVVYVFALVWCLWRFKKGLGLWAIVAIFCRLMMGFSRSVFYSGMRTFTPVAILFAVACALIASDKPDDKKQLAILCIGAAACTIVSITYLI